MPGLRWWQTPRPATLGLMTRTPHVTVLGTGRMGAAMAARFAEGHSVVTWSRSGRTVRGIDAAPTPSAAVKDADVVVLALFDGPACREVLGECLDEVPDRAVVVNTTTVAPDEAVELAHLVSRAGRRYLHAPVMGSVPAVDAGRLTVLGGGPVGEVAQHVLSRLGTILATDGPAEAAALKLVAIGVLGDALLGLRAALGRGARAGLDRTATLEVLERTPLGALAASKRELLIDGHPGALGEEAQFAIEALAKDLALLGTLTSSPHPAAQLIETLRRDGRLANSHDIMALCVAQPAPQPMAPLDGARLDDARLELRDGLAVPPDVLQPLHEYALGHATGSPEHFLRAFRPTAHIEGVRDGEFTSWDLQAYCARFDGPSPDEQHRRRILDSVDVEGSVATARMTLLHGDDEFTDLFLLVRDADRWQIANKVYHRARRSDRERN